MYDNCIPSNQRHGDRKNGHVLAAQQIIGDGVLFGKAPVVQADDDGQPEHDDERGVFRHPVYVFHGGVEDFRCV